MRIILLALISVAIFSCRSPQRLIEKAVKKDPKVLNEYSDTLYVYTDSIDTVHQEVIKYIESEPRIIERIIDNRKEIKEKKIESRNERQENRQDGRTERKDIKQSSKTDRVEERQGSWTTRQHKRQDERSSRSIGWWIGGILLAFILGMITMRVFSARMNFRNKI